jgi:enterochelin esterase-like enzyme
MAETFDDGPVAPFQLKIYPRGIPVISPRWQVLLLLLICSRAEANPVRNRPKLARTQAKIAGEILDYTHNHGEDNRLWSDSLGEKRDMYVYLPPGYDPKNRYPLVIWLHGFAQDEVAFIQHVIVPLDQGIACGKLAPFIMVAPDGSLHGRACLASSASFFINSKAGAFEDYIMRDIWNFMFEQFPIRPEREAHAIAGVSMGGGAAFSKAFKYRDRFKIVLGISPPLDTRWENDRGRYRANFSPERASERTDFTRRFEVVARFYGIFTIRMGQITRPLYGRETDIVDKVAAENPRDLLVSQNIQDGEFSMFVAYGGLDQFNIDAQVESFLHLANQLGIHLTVSYKRFGRHNRRTALSFLPDVLDWLEIQLAAYKVPSP